VINKITEPSEENFSEEFVKEIKMDKQRPYRDGLHTIREFGSLTLIDEKRRVLMIYKTLISLLRNLARIIK
jgi:hypothetical protein